MADRGYTRAPSDPGTVHTKLLPVAAWPAGDRILLVRSTGPAVAPRWAYLMFETAGTVLIEDEGGVVLPYTRAAGAVLPFSGVAIVKTAAAAYAGAPTETSATVVLYGHG
ncbi:MAG TPA: hypothetical protein VIQ29_23975 [Ancylobacter sp.]